MHIPHAPQCISRVEQLMQENNITPPTLPQMPQMPNSLSQLQQQITKQFPVTQQFCELPQQLSQRLSQGLPQGLPQQFSQQFSQLTQRFSNLPQQLPHLSQQFPTPPPQLSPSPPSAVYKSVIILLLSNARWNCLFPAHHISFSSSLSLCIFPFTHTLSLFLSVSLHFTLSL